MGWGNSSYILPRAPATFCPFPRNSSGLVRVEEDLSRQNDAKVVSRLLLIVFGL